VLCTPLVHTLLDVGGAVAADCLNVAKEVVQHVAPVAKHVDDDTAVVFLAVVPGRTLSRDVVALENPVAKLTAHAQDLTEKALLLEARNLAEAGEPKLVLNDAIFQTSVLCQAVELQSGLCIDRSGLFTVEVLASFNSLAHAIGAAARGLRVEVNCVVRVGQNGIKIRGCLCNAAHLNQFIELVLITADQDWVGHNALVWRNEQTALLDDGGDGAHEVLI